MLTSKRIKHLGGNKMKEKSTLYGIILIAIGIILVLVSRTANGSSIRDFTLGVLSGMAFVIMLVGAYVIGRGISKWKR